MSPDAVGECESCSKDNCASKARLSGESAEDAQARKVLASRLCHIQNKILVMSGKGGVGKSTVAVNLAVALSQAGRAVGLLDADLHGPSVPRMLGLEGERLRETSDGITPVRVDGLSVMSVGFFLPNPDTAVAWRGPMKAGFLRQVLADVAWGELDDLVVDCPPGTGDELLSLSQLIGQVSGAVIVTTPQEIALLDVRKSISFCRQMGVGILGVLENMSGFQCPHCSKVSEPFSHGGGERLALDAGVPFLGRVPLDREVMAAGEGGRPYLLGRPSSEVSGLYNDIVRRIANGHGEATSLRQPVSLQ